MHFSKLALVVVAALSAQGTVAVEDYHCEWQSGEPDLKFYCCAFQMIRQPKITPFITSN